VAVEPGESLSGWITASRPELIIMAPQIVHADPALALAKVRAVPRGRVPIFLVGDAADEARLRTLADGFFVRPIAPDLLLERARAILTPPLGAPRRRKDSSLDLERTEMGIGPAAPLAIPMGRPKSSPHPARPAGSTLRPLVAAALGGAPIAPVRSAGDASALLAELGAGIDALLDAELDAALAIAPKVARSEAKTVERPTQPPHPELVAGGDFAGETTKKVEPAQLGVAAKTLEKPPENARARLLARYAPVEYGDYFAVLNVARDASVADLRRAHEKILRETASDSLDPGVAGELVAEIDAIRTVVAEALRVLSDDNLRTRYASRIPK